METPSLTGDVALKRSGQIRCLTRWMKAQWPGNQRLSHCLSLIGHSNGGGGAFLSAGFIQDEFDDAEIAAVVGIAPVREIRPLYNTSSRAFPYLVISGSRDFQSGDGGLWSWERVSPEEASLAAARNKTTIWAYDVAHNSLGGSLQLNNYDEDDIVYEDMLEKGRTIANQYAPHFLRWQVLGDLDPRERFVGDVIPTELNVPVWWNYLPQYTGIPVVVPCIPNRNAPCHDD